MAVKEVELVKKENTDQEIELILIRQGENFIKSLQVISQYKGQAEYFKKINGDKYSAKGPLLGLPNKPNRDNIICFYRVSDGNQEIIEALLELDNVLARCQIDKEGVLRDIDYLDPESDQRLRQLGVANTEATQTPVKGRQR
ncbi:MAG: hypothetical protein PHF47_03220 [Bacilli bacterium]|nr:hypothetical protein [Bacilli bacterium]